MYLAIITPSALDAKEPMLSKLLAILAASRKPPAAAVLLVDGRPEDISPATESQH